MRSARFRRTERFGQILNPVAAAPCSPSWKSANGEEIGLFTPGPPYSQLDAVTFGQQQTDISYGRYPDGLAVQGSLSQPTPRWLNVGP
jgi:hypothetical protein